MKRILAILAALVMLAPLWAGAAEVVFAPAGLTGGTSGKLDAIPVSTDSGVSVAGSIAITRHATGGRVYIHELVTSGGAESSPHIITPDDAGAGNTRWYCVGDLNSGTSIWQAVIATLDDIAESGTSKTVTATLRSQIEAYLSGNTTYYTGVTAEVQGQLNTVRGTADAAYAWGDHSAANYLDLDTQTLDNLPDGTTYKLIPALTKTQLDSLLSGNTTYYTGVTAEVQGQLNTVRGTADAAYGWGDHSGAGYLTGEADATALAALTAHTTEAAIRATGFMLTSLAGITVYGSDGSSASGVSNLTIVRAENGTSTTAVATGGGSAILYYGDKLGAGGSGVTVWESPGSGAIYYSGGIVFVGANPETGVSPLEVNGGVSAQGLHIGSAVGNPSTGILFGDGDAGLYELTDDALAFQVGLINKILFEAAYMRHAAGGWALINEAASTTNPNITYLDGDDDSGMGGTAGHPSLIADGVEFLRGSQSGVSIIGNVDIQGGVSAIGRHEFKDTTGTSQMTVDENGVHVKTPLVPTAATNKEYVDGEVTSLEDTTSGTSLFTVAFAISMPYDLVPSGATQIPVFHLDPQKYPSGITVVSMDVRNTSGSTTYTLTYEVWENGSYDSQIGRVTSASGVSGFQSGTTEVLQEQGVDKEIFVSLPSTAVYVIRGSLQFFRRPE